MFILVIWSIYLRGCLMGGGNKANFKNIVRVPSDSCYIIINNIVHIMLR